jgi:hypothetical protein
MWGIVADVVGGWVTQTPGCGAEVAECFSAPTRPNSTTKGG